MIPDKPIFYIARLVLETCTPLSIATGESIDGTANNLLVRDANGLPAIPGSSLAGVLRHAYQRVYDTPSKSNPKELSETDKLFGNPKQSKTDTREDQADTTEDQDNPSFVRVSWACLHDSQDKPVEGLLNPYPEKEPRWQDPLIKDARRETPIKRDHVKLSHRGVSDAKKQGKFDRSSLTKGHRFSVEISWWNEQEDDQRWENLLTLLQRPDFRLGGGTRRGLGKLKLVPENCYTGVFNLKEPSQFELFCQLPQKLAETRQYIDNNPKLKPLKKLNQSIGDIQIITLSLTPIDGYRFGGGVEPLVKNSQADMLVVTERCVEWNNGEGKLTDKQIVIPASGVKGALSHRVAYHYNVLNRIFADQKLNNPNTAFEDAKPYVEENNQAIQALFGYVKENQNADNSLKHDETAQIGCLILDDVHLSRNKREKLQPIEYSHNSVNRFTGGVRDGALFFEEVVTDSQAFELNITVALPHDDQLPKIWKKLKQEQKLNKVWQALQLALNDLVEGELALGAGGGRGHGYFKGELKEAGKKWLENKVQEENHNATK